MHARAWPFHTSLLWILSLLIGSAGCGSTLYVNQVTRRASASVAAAEAAGAAEYAPYHYTLAVAYLRKAREEAAHADFQAANRFGRLSEEAAETARTLALQRAANPGDRSWRPPPGAPDGPPRRSPAGDGEAQPGPEASDDGSDGESADQTPPASTPAGAAGTPAVEDNR